MWFTYSLMTIIAWGGSDLFSKKGTNPKDGYSHWRLVIVVGFIMGIHAICYILSTGYDYSPIGIIKYFPVAGVYIFAMILGYAGLRYLQLSVSSPICNSSGAVSAMLCFLVLGQRMTGIQLFAVMLICMGIFSLSYFEKIQNNIVEKTVKTAANNKKTLGIIAIIFPVLYCFIDGMGSFMDAYYLENLMDEAQANLSYEFTFLIIAILALVYLVFVRKQQFSFFREKTFACAGLCETAGQFTYVYAMSDNAIVAAPMIASYSIVSVVLSRIFLKEKLSRYQYLSIALVMIGIAILGFE